MKEPDPISFPVQGMAPFGGLALNLTDSIRKDLRDASRLFISAGAKLKLALEREEWKRLNYPNPTAYFEHALNISDAWAYDLIRIAEIRTQFPAYAPRIIDAGVSKMRLLLPALKDNADEGTLDGLLDEANNKSWNELRRVLKAAHDGGGEREEHPSPWSFIKCPRCSAIIEVNRTVNYRLAPESDQSHDRARVVGHDE